MKNIFNKLSTLGFSIALSLASNLCFALDGGANNGLDGISEKLQKVTNTMTGPMAFVLSVAGLIIAAGVWKFAGHVAGMKFISGVIAGLLIIANAVGWVTYFTGAII